LKTLTLPQGTWTYSDGKPLGSPGGFATVFPGMSENGDSVAVKVFHSSDPTAARRELKFAEERISRTDEHVIAVYGCGIDPDSGHACIVMPRADYSLAEKLTGDGPLDEVAALNVAHAVVRGLQAVRAWVHRDLKPANLLWCDDRWQLADFGIARQADASTAVSTMKHYLSAAYAAPEQWNGERATHKTDVYALGCLLQEVLSGRPPFPGPGWDDFAEQHRLDAPKALAGSARMKVLLALMLSKSPASRPELNELEKRFSECEKSRPLSKVAYGLAQAAANIAETDAIRQAGAAAANRESRDRATIQLDALRELDELAQTLLDRIHEIAPNAQISSARPSPSAVRTALLGSGQLTLSVGQFRSLSIGLFAASGWDVVCGDSIKVAQDGGRGRSASLWYARRGATGPYEWIEVSYWSLWPADPRVPQPCFLSPGRDADYAASNTMHVWQLAHPPRSLRGVGRDDFIERWIEHFAAAATGRLQTPSRLPET